ncbi:DinB superfamily protein [Algoriphagus locisalis]|uniref:DinB superfamily protein n=1 Tax=Algoriphagus locisalis TaxID=305507 RepID=A0A1I7DPF0_9BACT|nr:DinB family protein [Algoriphagus locisalis]SFU13506.1 DinB superfamily protein [Algoriphagus locisalis]
MKESQRIQRLYSKQYNGDSWLGVNFVDKLNQITLTQAAHKFSPSTNSIWEILNHLIRWRKLVLEGIPHNTYTSPFHNFFQPITNPSKEEWLKTLDLLRDSEEAWQEYLSNLDESIFDKAFGDKQYNYHELIHGVLHHDIYHLGQISLLARLTREIL